VGRFQATLDFSSSLEEVERLLTLAAHGGVDSVAFSALLKSSILLLTSKMEAFLEDVAEECRFRIESAACIASKLPDAIKVSMVQSVIDEAFISKLKQGSPQVLEKISALKAMLVDEKIEALALDTRFSYGKHGEAEVKKIFQRFGIRDVIQESVLDGADSIRADLNSLIAIRNNIIHNDASPVFTIEQVRGFVTMIVGFSNGLDGCLHAYCTNIVE
jgi:hypothetical protein